MVKKKRTNLMNPFAMLGDLIKRGRSHNLIIVDTGTIIDWERYSVKEREAYMEEARNWQIRECQAGSCADYLYALNSKVGHVVFPVPIWYEILNHNNMTIGKRPEISYRTVQTLEDIKAINSWILNELEKDVEEGRMDQAGLHAYLVAKEIERQDREEGRKTEISEADRDLVKFAAHASSKDQRRVRVDNVLVLSTDSHIERMIELMGEIKDDRNNPVYNLNFRRTRPIPNRRIYN